MAEVKNINGITVIEGDRAFLSALLQTAKEALERGTSITLFNGELKIVVSQSPVNVHNLSLRLREWERLKDNYRTLIYFLAKYRGLEKSDSNWEWERKLFFDEKGLLLHAVGTPLVRSESRIGHLFSVLSVYNRSGVLYLLENWEKESVVKIPYRNDFELFLGLTKSENREEVSVKEIGALLKTVYGTVRDFVERVKGEMS